MPSISFGEVVVILLVTVLFVRPEELPGFLRRIGRLYGQFLGYIEQVRGYGRDTYHHVTTLDQARVDALKPAAPTPAPAPTPASPVPAAAPTVPAADVSASQVAAPPPLLPRPAPGMLPVAPTPAVPSAPAPAALVLPRPRRRGGPRLYGPPQRPPAPPPA